MCQVITYIGFFPLLQRFLLKITGAMFEAEQAVGEESRDIRGVFFICWFLGLFCFVVFEGLLAEVHLPHSLEPADWLQKCRETFLK